eukprot:TRINITY_DN68566_c0_g1_i1.p1 TRINITY_DN68566_c0_g1~~TRINITY_DN68566_c0_g1_i1.p1  ORF type:complete len:221 (-),score=28.50 TRINITY_DN68566_c0_g1_i1:66-728(-)
MASVGSSRCYSHSSCDRRILAEALERMQVETIDNDQLEEACARLITEFNAAKKPQDIGSKVPANHVQLRALSKSLVLPILLCFVESWLLIGSAAWLRGTSRANCEAKLRIFVAVCQVGWIIVLILSMGCFVDGFWITNSDPKRLPFGQQCLPLASALACVKIGLVLWTFVGVSWYFEVVSIEEPQKACNGRYVSFTTWVAFGHASFVIMLICALFGALFI